MFKWKVVGEILSGRRAPDTLAAIARVGPDSVLVIPPRILALRVAKSYAEEVAHNRAIPDILDGLLPVHRRLLYACYKGGYVPGKPPRKTAKIVGDVLGDFHPHGGQSVQDAIDTLVQMPVPSFDGTISSFASPFIEGVDSAAMRYTETRLTAYGQSFVNPEYLPSVHFVDNYDATQKEPWQLPATLPNILLNRIEGVGFGIATRIPPFDPASVLTLLRAWLTQGPQDAEACARTLKLAYRQNPVVLDGPDVLKKVFAQGGGTVRVAPRCVHDAKTNTVRLVGLPPRWKYSKLADIFDKAKLDFAELQDHSTQDGYDIHVRYKKGTDPKAFEAALVKALTTTMPMRWVVTDRKPNRVDILETPLPTLVGLWVDRRLALEKKRLLHVQKNIKEALAANAYDAYLFQNRDVIMGALRAPDAAQALQKNLALTAQEAATILRQPTQKLTRQSYAAMQDKKAALEKQLEDCQKSLLNLKATTLKSIEQAFATCLGLTS